MKNWILVVVMIVGCAGKLNAAADADAKIIAWGIVPPPVYVQGHIEEMEKVPVDGLVLSLYGNGHHDPTTKPDRVRAFHSGCWTPRVRTREEYSESIEALKKTKFHRFTDNFLRFNVVPAEIDWFDPRFTGVVANFRFLAEVAKETGMKGIMFDTEAYPPAKVFWYAHQNEAGKHSVEKYRARVRECGKAMMSAASEVFPDIKVIFTLAYENAEGEPEKYGLLPAFLDGMLEGSTPRSVLYDGYEFSYKYRTAEEFVEKRRVIREKELAWTGVPELMRQRWRAGFGIWIDYDQKWDAIDWQKNFFTPTELAYSLHLAMKYTDRYVWIWSEKTGFWQGNIPGAYIDALKEARRDEVRKPPARPDAK